MNTGNLVKVEEDKFYYLLEPCENIQGNLVYNKYIFNEQEARLLIEHWGIISRICKLNTNLVILGEK